MIRSDERRQAATGAPGWCDVIDLLAVSDNGDTAIASQFGLYPSAGVAGLQICVWLPNQVPTVLTDSELRIPNRLWEVRGSGLWAEHVCEIPLVHWSYGLEAFALEIDDSRELLGRGHGTRVPLGWELEFETDLSRDTCSEPPSQERERIGAEGGLSDGAYRQEGKVHGLLLTKGGSIEFSGIGSRGHRWGTHAVTRSDWAADHSAGREQGHGLEPTDRWVALPGSGHIMWAGFSEGSIPIVKSEMVGP